MREYVYEREQLTPVCTLPPFPGRSFCISVDDDRSSVLVADLIGREVRVCAREGDRGWSHVHTLKRDTHAAIGIQSLCLLASNTLALFDDKSDSVLLYEFA